MYINENIIEIKVSKYTDCFKLASSICDSLQKHKVIQTVLIGQEANYIQTKALILMHKLLENMNIIDIQLKPDFKKIIDNSVEKVAIVWNIQCKI